MLLLLFSLSLFSVRHRTKGFVHAKRMLYHWAMYPPTYFCSKYCQLYTVLPLLDSPVYTQAALTLIFFALLSIMANKVLNEGQILLNSLN